MVSRTKPQVGETHRLLSYTKSDHSPMSCVGAALVTVIAYLVLSAIVRVMSNSGTKSDQIVCYGTLIFLVILMVWGVRIAYRDSRARQAQRKSWAKGCETALLTIVSRHEAVSWWDDYYSRGRSAPADLVLEMNSDQKAVSPNGTTIKAEVSDYVYNRLKGCNTVRVYYMRESPTAFLLEEEL